MGKNWNKGDKLSRAEKLALREAVKPKCAYFKRADPLWVIALGFEDILKLYGAVKQYGSWQNINALTKCTSLRSIVVMMAGLTK